MRGRFWSWILVVLLGAGPTVARAAALTRQYFGVGQGPLPERLLRYVVHRLPNGIVSVEAPPESLTVLAGLPLTSWIDSVRVFRPLAMEASPGVFQHLPVSGLASATARACSLSVFGLPQVDWGVKAICGDTSLTRTSGGDGVKVGVLDTGVYPHPDVVRRLRYCIDETTNPPDSSCWDGRTPGGHGTGVASIIAADGGEDGLGKFGIAPDALLYSAKVCVGDYCSEDDMAAGIYKLVDQGVNIINISLGGPSFGSVLKDALDYAVARNVLIVAAAGNYFGSGPNYDTILYPAAYWRVVSVGAILEDYSTWISSARGVNDGDYIREEREVEFGAPGYSLIASASDGCYIYFGATSGASPHVAGLAARIWDGDALSTRTRLQNSARLHDLDVPGDDPATGFGLPVLMHTADVTESEPGEEPERLGGRPNPFRESVSLPFAITTRQWARVRVLDVTGRLVRELMQGPLEPGAHMVRWDGFDRRGAACASGLYFVQVQLGERVVTTRVARVR